MLKQKVLDKLNQQINLEHYSSNFYLAMSSWSQSQGLDGAEQHEEEALFKTMIDNEIAKISALKVASAV
jgi:ferritin